ncbi:uncharacterized protein LOC110458520, partial [Mizuhopecten yessoensis]|uniref:uncharacterized protein LOC110458520 n=1 Tax=Mizuhopecten yessoensis TaxID=6573 RepID=UPI000B458B87
PITVNSNPCDVFASTSTTGCGDGKTCEVVGGSATCLTIQQPSDDLGVLVGIGFGVTAVLLLVIIVLIWMCMRSRSRRHQTTKNTLRPGTPTFMPTRFHANVPSWSHQPAFYDNNGLDLSDSRKFMPASIETLPYYRNDYHETRAQDITLGTTDQLSTDNSTSCEFEKLARVTGSCQFVERDLSQSTE